jgi:hypothetical protein
MVKRLIDNKIPIRGLTLCYLLGLCLLWIYFAWDYTQSWLIFASPHDRRLFVLAILLLASGMLLLFLVAIVGVWFYVYHDAVRRGMNPWLWTAIAIFTPNLLGILIYLIVRKPLMMECPDCRARLESQLLYCPHCGRQFKQKCPACNAVVEQGFQFCGGCGASLSATAR